MQVKVRLQATLKRSEVWVEFIVVLCVAVNAGKCPGNWIGIFFTLDFTLDFIFFSPTVEKYLHGSAEVGSSSESGHSLVLNAVFF